MFCFGTKTMFPLKILHKTSTASNEEVEFLVVGNPWQSQIREGFVRNNKIPGASPWIWQLCRHSIGYTTHKFPSQKYLSQSFSLELYKLHFNHIDGNNLSTFFPKAGHFLPQFQIKKNNNRGRRESFPTYCHVTSSPYPCQVGSPTVYGCMLHLCSLHLGHHLHACVRKSFSIAKITHVEHRLARWVNCLIT